MSFAGGPKLQIGDYVGDCASFTCAPHLITGQDTILTDLRRSPIPTAIVRPTLDEMSISMRLKPPQLPSRLLIIEPAVQLRMRRALLPLPRPPVIKIIVQALSLLILTSRAIVQVLSICNRPVARV